MPLDTFVDAPAERMEVVGDASVLPTVQREAQREVDDAEGRSVPFAPVERFAFYSTSARKRPYCVIAPGEARGYGCFIFKKGAARAGCA